MYGVQYPNVRHNGEGPDMLFSCLLLAREYEYHCRSSPERTSSRIYEKTIFVYDAQ